MLLLSRLLETVGVFRIVRCSRIYSAIRVEAEPTMGQSSTKQTKITFHETHGQDIELGDDSAAVRVENRATSWSNGLVFSAEPIKINQRIYLRLVVVSRGCHDVITVGFTGVNPSALEETDYESKSWTCTLSKYFCPEDTVICFYVNGSGTIHYGRSNGAFYKVWNRKVDLSKPIWAFFHIWSEPTTIRLISQSEAKQNVFKEEVRVDFAQDDARIKRVTKDIGAVTESSNDDDTCTICWSNNIDVVFVPCGHLCACFQCGQTIEQKDSLCPICRKDIDSVVRVYKS